MVYSHCTGTGQGMGPDWNWDQWVLIYLPPANEVCEGYVFTPVSHSVHSGEYLGRYPPPPARYTPLAGTPPGRYTAPGQVHPPATVHAGIRSTSGRYASHWNAFLYAEMFTLVQERDRDHEPLFLFVPVRFPPLRPGPVQCE